MRAENNNVVVVEHLEYEALFKLYANMEVWTHYDPNHIKSEHGRSYIPKATMEWFNLFDKLYFIVGDNARFGKAISKLELIQELGRDNIVITGPPLVLRDAPVMVSVQVGVFSMGGDDIDGLPQQEVKLDSYRISKRPVTKKQYKQFLLENMGQKIPRAAGWDGRECPNSEENDPVVGISWNDACAYCHWLNLAEKKLNKTEF